MKILDHGYIEFIESWGSDERIIESARMSTGKGFEGWGPRSCRGCGRSFTEHPNGHALDCKDPVYPEGDEKLLRYLWEHKHHTPFEMAGMTIEVQAPIFVFREWHRHRTQSFNELSARYSPVPDLNYLPTVERLMHSGGNNKQASGLSGHVLKEGVADFWLRDLAHLVEDLEDLYQRGLECGVPKELARLAMTVGRYSRMRASANIRNWLGFLSLRLDPAAQWEIREYAKGVGEFIALQFPRTWELFKENK